MKNFSLWLPMALKIFPQFAVPWERHKEYWGNEEAGDYNDISVLADFVAANHDNVSEAALEEFFVTVEKLISSSPKSKRDTTNIGDVLCAGFLEDLINLETSKPNATFRFVDFFGANTRKFCKAIDRYHGVSTPKL